MNTSKDYFLSLLGASVPGELMKHNLSFQRKNESEPFCAIITDKSGRTFFRANPWDDDSIRLTIP
jgi:hypothetical protein